MNLRLPAEYEPQSAIWLTWPGNPCTWPDCREVAEKAYAHFVAMVSHYQKVALICCASWQALARQRLAEANADLKEITWYDWPVNDAWCRDHGPLFVINSQGRKEVVDFQYNAWGGKFSPWDADDAVPSRVSEGRNLSRHRIPKFGEGGAIEVNRKGLLLTTASVWLNDNRNPGWTREEAESCFENFLGVRETLWLDEGLIGDDTDGHIDTISRFVDDDRVVTSLCTKSDPNYPVLQANLEQLKERVEVTALPHPAPIWKDGQRLPATYANFLILNEAVLVPTYRQADSDKKALDLLGELYTGREIVGVPSEVFIREGGSLHCLSMQEPV